MCGCVDVGVWVRVCGCGCVRARASDSWRAVDNLKETIVSLKAFHRDDALSSGDHQPSDEFESLGHHHRCSRKFSINLTLERVLQGRRLASHSTFRREENIRFLLYIDLITPILYLIRRYKTETVLYRKKIEETRW